MKWFTFHCKGHLALATLSKRLDGANEKARKLNERIVALEGQLARLGPILENNKERIHTAFTRIEKCEAEFSAVHQRNCDAMELIGQLRERQPITEVKKGPIVARTFKQFQAAMGDATQPQEGESNVS